jgi:hypothetical protein
MTAPARDIPADNERSWTADALRARGFQGFVRFTDLAHADVPRGAGVYAVLWPDDAEPTYLSVSVAGRFKQRDPSVAVERLRNKWIATSAVIYIGKATPGRDGRRGLRQRLDEYRRIGAGEPVGHWGGRLVWQLERHEELLVAWRETAGEDAGAIETRMLEQFIADHGALPYANLRR